MLCLSLELLLAACPICREQQGPGRECPRCPVQARHQRGLDPETIDPKNPTFLGLARTELPSGAHVSGTAPSAITCSSDATAS